MKIKNQILTLACLATIFVLLMSGCSQEEGIEIPTTKEYVGSQECALCHKAVYDEFVKSGHPYKIMKVTDGKQPNIPFLPTIQLPDGYTWNNISYTIGGFGWKMRFIDKSGYVVTQVPGSQFNVGNNSRSVYGSSVANGTEKYTCGGCHTTGWKSIADGGIPQDGLAGMGGEFFAGGIHCEACHGQGNIHLVTKSKADMVVDRTNALCAKCHERRWEAKDKKQQVSGGWEMHRNQIEQLSTNKHNELTCVGCHNPHASTTKDAQAHGEGIKKKCTGCHTNTTKYASTMHYGATCVNCHMPKTVKNAISVNKYIGDAPNHNFKINTSATAEYLTKDANNVSWANADKKGSTLDFACYQCHKDEAGVGGPNSIKTRAQLAAKAVTFHK